MKKIMESFKIRLSFLEWFGSSVVNNFYNYLAPKSGTIIVGAYFKNKYKLDYNKYAGLVLTTAIITVLTSGLGGMVASIYLFNRHLVANLLLPAVCFILFAVPVAVMIMPRVYLPKRAAFNKPLGRFINKFLYGWHRLRKDKKMLLWLSLLDIGIVLQLALRYYILFRVFSMNVNFMACILISPFNIITHFATLIPGGYGVKEATIGIVSKATGIGFSPGLITTLSDRIIMMTLSFITGPIFSFLLLKKVFIIQKKGISK